MTKKDKIELRLKEDYVYIRDNYPDYDIVGVFLAGSQNYGIDSPSSDIDTKAIVIPSLRLISMNKAPLSVEHTLPGNEHLEIKDIRLMFDCFLKQNINFVEILFTHYFLITPRYQKLVEDLWTHAEQIARYDKNAFAHCMLGVIYNRLKYVEASGYTDGKQLSHIYRIYYFFKDFFEEDLPYADCLMSSHRQELLDIKYAENLDPDIQKARVAQMLEEVKEKVEKIKAEKPEKLVWVKEYLDLVAWNAFSVYYFSMV